MSDRIMKAMLVNTSMHEHGCTDRALREIADVLKAQGIQADIFWLGKGHIADSLEPKTEPDVVDQLDKLIPDYDAFVFGSPVYYANANARLTAFLNRIFYGKGKRFNGKVGAGIASCRRAGGVTTVDEIQHWMELCSMIVPTSCYWNVVHGNTPAEVEQDKEGINVMRQLGEMIAYCLKLKKLGDENGIEPVILPTVRTNFIR